MKPEFSTSGAAGESRRIEPTAPAANGQSTPEVVTHDRSMEVENNQQQDARGPIPEPVARVSKMKYTDTWCLYYPNMPNPAEGDIPLYSAEQLQAVMEERDKAIQRAKLLTVCHINVVAERDAIAQNSNIAHQKMVDALEQVGAERDAVRRALSATVDEKIIMQAVVDAGRGIVAANIVSKRSDLWHSLAALDAFRKEQGK